MESYEQSFMRDKWKNFGPIGLCSQMVSEKVGGAEGTKLDEDFKDLERVTYINVQKMPTPNMWNNNLFFLFTKS